MFNRTPLGQRLKALAHSGECRLATAVWAHDRCAPRIINLKIAVFQHDLLGVCCSVDLAGVSEQVQISISRTVNSNRLGEILLVSSEEHSRYVKLL